MTTRGWQTKTIGELCDFSSGHGFGPRDWADTGIPIIRIQNLNGEKDFNYFQGKPEPDWLVEPGTILFAWAGTRGVSFGPTIWNGPQGVLNQHIFRVQSRQGVERKWLYLALRDATDRIERKAHGFKSTLLHVGKKDITKQLIQVPPLPEQRKIADILTAWDKALEKFDALISAKEHRKKALMQQLLTGKKRMKGVTGAFVTTKLGDLFTDRVEQNRLDLKLLSITADRGIVRRDGLVKRDTSSEDKSKYLRIAPGDIGYNTMRMWQGVSALSSLEGIVSPAYTICIPNKRIDARFAAHFFKSPHTIHLFHRYSQGLVDDTLNLKFPAFATIEVTIPADIKKQRRIAAILDTCDEELRLLRVKREALDQQKRGLMQSLLPGKVRVSTGGVYA